MDAVITSIGRSAEQRTTLYKHAPDTQRRSSYTCTPLSPPVQSPAGRFARLGSRRNAEVHR
jgi:hypothetical protein